MLLTLPQSILCSVDTSSTENSLHRTYCRENISIKNSLKKLGFLVHLSSAQGELLGSLDFGVRRRASTIFVRASVNNLLSLYNVQDTGVTNYVLI